MKKKQRELLQFLIGQSLPVTSSVLSEQLHISVRTVKSFIKDINSTSEHRVIHSGKLGYRIAGDYVLPDASTDADVPQNQEERSHYIIKLMMIEHASIDIFDLCEELYISYATLKLTISQMNKTFKRFEVRFAALDGKLQMLGTEQHKRRLISQIIFDETSSRFLDLKSLESTFSADKIEQMAQLVKSYFKSHDYYLNDFSFVNLVLHFLILTERVQQGEYISQPCSESSAPSGAKQLDEEFAMLLESTFHLELSEQEKHQLSILIQTYVNYGASKNASELIAIVGQENISRIYDIILSVNEIYVINLINDNFLPPFYLHIKGLLTRARQHTYNKNPMLDSIKQECRIIFDIAIYIALAIEQHFGISINEEETAFIALHVGAELERQKQVEKKIPCALLCPDYYRMRDEILQQLNRDFGNELHFTAVVSSPSELADEHFELLFSTIEVEPGSDYETIVITPFRLQKKKLDISEKIERIKFNEKKRILQRNYKDFFDRELFYANPPFTSKEELFRTVCGDMLQMGYVESGFEQQVCDRERASSTAFGDLALPHSIQMDAVKTCIAVIISKQGILWDDEKKVHVIFLTAINRIDRSHFAAIYEAMITLFDNREALDRLKSIVTFREFVDFIKSV